ncbi:adenosylcobyric acid synthase (glutamine-hydrolysing) [Halopenitus malekzadehii]|uniref:Probable cobyric acid synthase n=1 Tax=Halopenitus malekzadehii TaxID=1267564 RepID=A0A1H6HWL4_9EURY|nr:cobyric acid synthase [Halopenitus malekzadehii]SEH39455.1 adenosylcobyric acid synthase (glutamine-hydrolysing) [Halopenitus malekzadehii]
MTRSDTRTLLVAGTASHVGKSTVAAGLCRLLADRGVDVAPFKAQNMSNNARAVPRATGSDHSPAAESDAGSGFGEIGVSQYTQARAARVPPTTDHNPVLLKPSGGGESQVVIDGVPAATVPAGEYYDDHWETARTAVDDAHARLAADAEMIVAEGAGSIAEINLHDRDLANIETARIADADVLLVADIERGGVFASLVGTLELLPDDVRDRVVGVVITKFRGDRSLLKPGLEAFEDRTGVPVRGVLPFDDPGLPAEDSVDLPAADARTPTVRGDDDGVPPTDAITIAVPRLPRISNVTDLEPLAAEPGVHVQYLPVGDRRDVGSGSAAPLADADAVVLPGTKNTVDDLIALRDAGLAAAIRDFEGPVVGLCGGYQLLGDRILNADVEGTTDVSTVEGLGLLPVETVFSHDKHVVETTRRIDGVGPLAGATGTVRGYEIHMGETRPASRDAPLAAGVDPALQTPFSAMTDTDVVGDDADDGGAADGGDVDRDDRDGVALGAALGGRSGVVGTYLHGLFENRDARSAFLAAAGGSDPDRSIDRFRDSAGEDPSPYDAAADLLVEHVDLDGLLPDR